MADTTNSIKTNLSGFEILEKVGQGGMGAVFKARQINMDRIVALKILPKKLAADPKYKERFFREARLSARLNHLNIVNAIDCGEAGGYTFFAMEYVEGKTGKHLLKEKGTLAVEEAVPIVRQIAEALRYANTQQLIHRDIKPDNIMITKDGTAKLLDLGLAKTTGQSEDSSLTQTGQAVGTPHYISPEQARGEANLDTRTDIYSLGATFYHFLTGKTLFPDGSPATIMAKHLIESAPAVTELNPEVPEDWAAIVSKMTAKDPKDRYADFSEFLADLEAVEHKIVPSAMNFRGKTTCAMPPKVKPGKRGVGGTTGMKAPIRPANTTGPRMPVKERSTTGPNSPVGPRNTTGLNAPIGARVTRERPAAANNGASSMIVAGVAAAIVLVLLVVMLGGGKKDPPRPVAKADAPVPVPPPAAPVTPAAIQKTVSTSPEPEPPARPAPPEPEPEAKPPEPAPAPAPEPAKTAEPAAPPEAKTTEPQEPDTAAKAEPAAPADDPAAALAFAKYLGEVLEKGRMVELSKVTDEARALSRKPEFAPAKALIAQDLKDLDRAVKIEKAGLETLGAAKGEIDLPEDLARKYGVAKVKVEKYDEGRGLSVSAKGVGMSLAGLNVPVAMVEAAAKGKGEPLDHAAYLIARGSYPEALAMLTSLPPPEAERLGRKLDLLKAGATELKAREAYDGLAQLFAQKSYKPFMEKAEAFEKEHGETEAAKAKAGELAQWKEIADQVLNPNPLPKVLHAAQCKPVGDGYFEITYDFSTVEQAKDFTGEHGNPMVEKGQGLTVPPFGGEYSHAKFIAPIQAIKHFEAVTRSVQQWRSGRYGVYWVTPDLPNWNLATKMVVRPYNGCAHLENWAPPFAQNWNNGGGLNAVGSKQIDVLKDFPIVATGNGKELKWTVNGEDIGTVKVPDSVAGGYLALAYTNGEHCWSRIRMIVKVDAAWAKQQLEKAKP
ncbi:MAG: serine/threonine protein kinase [Planctomycetota bacterium]|nr:serine/threonine protein kinase [Planctomycetota bacterium]